jgi:hypothetical protein
MTKARELDKALTSRTNAYNLRHAPNVLAGQRGGASIIGDEKTRLVWIYPAEILAVEARVAVPLYDAYVKRPARPMLYGNEPDKMMAEWMSRTNSNDNLWVGMDISHFDGGVPDYMIDWAFDIIEMNVSFVDPKIFHLLANHPKRQQRYLAYCNRYRDSWRSFIQGYFTHTPLRMPDGTRWRKNRGVPSGTAFTQLVDSIVNYIYIAYTAEMQEAKILHLTVLGDDSGFTSTRFDLPRACEDLVLLGASAHPDKCLITDNATQFEMLGFTYTGLKRNRPIEDWFLMSVCPETRVRSPSDSMSRLLGIHYAGARHCKRFCDFFSFFQTCYDFDDEVRMPPSFGFFMTTDPRYDWKKRPLMMSIRSTEWFNPNK